jgi:uncharacterized membrane protein YtjA (UPF0391 family)
MLYYALVFFILAMVAGALGFGGIAGAMVDVAIILFYLFLAVFLVAFVAGLLRGRPPIL